VIVNSANAASTTSNSASLVVIPPPVVSKSYRGVLTGGAIDALTLVTTLIVGSDAYLEISIQNTNGFIATGVALTDLVPANLEVVSINTIGAGCVAATFTSTTISLASGTLPPFG
jgi:hypothetical protein